MQIIGGASTWTDALERVGALGVAGYNDWRLPNRKELFSLADRSKVNSSLPEGHAFTSVVTSGYAPYWSSSTNVNDQPDYAWFVFMNNGNLSHHRKDMYGYAWPVRGGQTGEVRNITPYLWQFLFDD